MGQRYREGENMGRQIRAIAICLSFLMLGPFGTDTFAKGPKNPHGRGPKNPHARKAKNFHAGAVYVLTNQASNSVAVFRRNAKGMLTSAGEFPTGGAGNPTPQPRQSDPAAARSSDRSASFARRFAYRPG